MMRHASGRRPRLRLWVAVVTLTAACAAPRPPTAGGGPLVFRELRIGDDTIPLGRPWPRAARFVAAGDTVVALLGGAAGGAERVRVHLTPAGEVRRIWIDYPQSADYERLLAAYAATLGEPRRGRWRRGELARWEDAQTRFDLVRDPERNASTVFGVLTDRRLSAGLRAP
jgi:hypothetical protein